MRCFLKLSYNGASFHGWQSQPNAVSVQQTLEDALSTMLRRQVSVVGAGRTDTGVNARIMYAHLDLDTFPADKKRFLISLNRLCGPAIAVEDIIQVSPDAHARFDAVEREYRYFVTFCKSPFLKDSSWHSPSPLSIDAMNEAADLLLDTRDFTSFAKLHTDVKTNICDVREACWRNWENTFGVPGAVFIIRADRFLRNMVRAVVGTLVDVGRGKLSTEEFRDIINARNRGCAGTSMPPQALFLWNVAYPPKIYINEKQISDDSNSEEVII